MGLPPGLPIDGRTISERRDSSGAFNSPEHMPVDQSKRTAIQCAKGCCRDSRGHGDSGAGGCYRRGSTNPFWLASTPETSEDPDGNQRNSS